MKLIDKYDINGVKLHLGQTVLFSGYSRRVRLTGIIYYDERDFAVKVKPVHEWTTQTYFLKDIKKIEVVK